MLSENICSGWLCMTLFVFLTSRPLFPDWFRVIHLALSIRGDCKCNTFFSSESCPLLLSPSLSFSNHTYNTHKMIHGSKWCDGWRTSVSLGAKYSFFVIGFQNRPHSLMWFAYIMYVQKLQSDGWLHLPHIHFHSTFTSKGKPKHTHASPFSEVIPHHSI